MSNESLDYEDLRRIIELVESAPHVHDIRLKAGGIRIELRKRRSPPAPGSSRPPRPPSDQQDSRAPASSGLITSPLVGTFRRTEPQSGRPFVEVGDRVAADTTLCLVEVLDELNPIRAGKACIVLHLPLAEGAPVEFGQTLAVIEPIA